jgi:hypothetical protein
MKTSSGGFSAWNLVRGPRRTQHYRMALPDAVDREFKINAANPSDRSLLGAENVSDYLT